MDGGASQATARAPLESTSVCRSRSGSVYDWRVLHVTLRGAVRVPQRWNVPQLQRRHVQLFKRRRRGYKLFNLSSTARRWPP